MECASSRWFPGSRNMALSARPLDPSEWPIFKDLRLIALQTEPGAFCASYEASAAQSPEEWQNLIQGPGHQVFGLFDDSRLIGITGVVTAREDASGQTALLVMSFILPQYRRQGLSQRLYDVRLQWIRKHPKFKTIVVSHRESNEASRRANQRQGFKFVKRESRTWPDGRTEDELFYQLSVVGNT